MFWFFPFRNWDEAWYAEIIKNMASGNYNLLVPFWNGQYYFDKPPLYFWLSLPVVKLFGIGEWQVRLVSVLVFVGILWLIYLIGKKLFDRKAGIFSLLVFISLGQVFVRLSHGNLDALLIFFILLSFYFYLLSMSVKYAVLTGISVGLGFLIKGWSLGIYTLLVVSIYGLLVEGKLHRWKLIVFLSLVSAGWYYLLGYLTFGQKFLSWYVFTVAEGSFDGLFNNFSLDYFKYFIRDLGVWALILPLYLIKVKGLGDFKNRQLAVLVVMALAFVAGISFLDESGDWHLLPVYPFVALCIGYLVSRIFHTRIWVLLFFVLLFLQMVVAYKIEMIYPDRSIIGANLGVYTRGVARPRDTIILDDHDFTSFLFYSNVGRVYVPTREKLREREWWTVKEEELPVFIREHRPVLFISKNLELVRNQGTTNLISCYLEYCFFRYE